jgi:peptidoglycan glycosyltransferase
MTARFSRRRLLRSAALAGLGAAALGAGACRVVLRDSGLPPEAVFQREIDRLLHRPTVGDDVVLTVDAALQKVADDAFGDAAGAVVAVEPRTGGVLILLSKPNFHPNGIVFNPNTADNRTEVKRIEAAWAALLADPGHPLVNRATSGLYVPGSTFKTVTLAAALDRGIVAPNQTYRFTLKPPNAQQRVAWHDNQWTTCANHPQFAQLDLAGAYAWSCNVVFSELGVRLGPEVYSDYAKRFGLGESIPFNLPVEPSLLSVDPNYFKSQEGTYGLASTAFGQGQLQVTPLQMALIAATAANGGVMMKPQLVLERRNPDGTPISRPAPEPWRRPVSPQTAALVAQMMVGGVENGWASGVKLPGLPLGGKTGTAEIQQGTIPHSWFIGFGPFDSPRLALAVIVENAGFGSDRAAPIAKQIFQAALK